jgi:hypothetical protein
MYVILKSWIRILKKMTVSAKTERNSEERSIKGQAKKIM